jgi:hypothetical protein
VLRYCDCLWTAAGCASGWLWTAYGCGVDAFGLLLSVAIHLMTSSLVKNNQLRTGADKGNPTV